MVIKGGARGGPDGLAAHLLRTDHNERVSILESKGVSADTLRDALFEMDAMGVEAESERTLYHASINTRPGEDLTPEQRLIAIDRLEEELGLGGQPRVVVEHVKARKGQEEAGPHFHIVWSRIDRETMTAIPDSHNYHKHQKVARELEREFGHEPVRGTHYDNDGPRPARTPSHAEYQQAERSGIDPRDARAFLSAAWETSRNGQEFATEVERGGWILARGDRRGYVALDQAGEVHAINKKVTGVAAEEVRERLADLDPAQLPSVDHAKSLQRERGQARGMAESSHDNRHPLEIHHDDELARHRQAELDQAERKQIRADIREINGNLKGLGERAGFDRCCGPMAAEREEGKPTAPTLERGGREMKPRGRSGIGGLAGKALDSVGTGILKVISGLADSFASIFAAPTPPPAQPRQADSSASHKPPPQPYKWEPPKPQPRRSKTDDMLDEIARTRPARPRTAADELRDELGRERERRRFHRPGNG